MREQCNRCQADKPPEEQLWSCALCQNANADSASVCVMCEYPRDPDDLENLKQELGGSPDAYQPPQRSAGPPVAGANGNWACPGCNNVNFAVREACNRCQAPKPYEGAPSGGGGKGPRLVQLVTGGGKGSHGGPAAGVDGNWACPQCQNVNFAVRDACNRCQAPKATARAGQANWGVVVQPPPQGQWAAARPVAPMESAWGPPLLVNGNWQCPDCQNINFAVRSACNRCQAPRQVQAMPSYQPPQKGQGKGGPVAGVDGNWACPKCNNVNFAMREACNRCQEEKPAVPISDEELFAQLSQPADDPSAKRPRLY